jgi:hypothetical protein
MVAALALAGGAAVALTEKSKIGKIENQHTEEVRS